MALLIVSRPCAYVSARELKQTYSVARRYTLLLALFIHFATYEVAQLPNESDCLSGNKAVRADNYAQLAMLLRPSVEGAVIKI